MSYKDQLERASVLGLSVVDAYIAFEAEDRGFSKRDPKEFEYVCQSTSELYRKYGYSVEEALEAISKFCIMNPKRDLLSVKLSELLEIPV